MKQWHGFAYDVGVYRKPEIVFLKRPFYKKIKIFVYNINSMYFTIRLELLFIHLSILDLRFEIEKWNLSALTLRTGVVFAIQIIF